MDEMTGSEALALLTDSTSVWTVHFQMFGSDETNIVTNRAGVLRGMLAGTDIVFSIKEWA